MSTASAISPSLETSADPRGLGGLIALAGSSERPLPLESVRVRTTIVGGCARTLIEQRYHNPLTQPLEAVHLFPLPDEGAVVDLVLVCGDLEVRADLQEKVEAERTFAAARAAGHQAALLTQERPDVHTLRLTRLPTKESVLVRIEVVEFLPFVDGAWRWRFPTTIAPRYLPGAPVGHDGPGHLPDTDRVPDASHLQPPLRLEGGTLLDLEVHVQGAVHQLESSQHAVKLGLGGGGLRVAPAGHATCDADFVLAITSGPTEATGARAWTDGTHTLVQLEPPVAAQPATMPRDAVFVLDISGSMSGRKIEAARHALQSALHGLEPGDRFQLIAFDDRVEQFAPEFQPYTDATVRLADHWISQLHARGGTEMLPAIRAALDGERSPERLHTVLFITDGQAWNEAELVAAVANRSQGAAFFTLGIDSAVNSSLLRRLARVGGGTCELATPQDDIDEVIARLEGRFGSPVADGLSVVGHPSARLESATAFAGRPAVMLIEGHPKTVKVTATSSRTAWTAISERVDFPLGALWARRRLAALDDRLILRPYEAEAVRPEMVRVSLAHRVLCPFTAYVAVERSRTVDGALSTVVQPSELPRDWAAPAPGAAQHSPTLAGGLGTGAPMPVPMPAPRAPQASGMRRPPDPYAFDEVKMAPAPKKKPSLKRLFQKTRVAPTETMAEPTEAKHELFEGQRLRLDPPPPTAVEHIADAATLARLQSVDGSFGADVARTAAALLALVYLGHTRRKGARRRTVAKAARWLEQHPDAPAAILALAALAQLEAGTEPTLTTDWLDLTTVGPEGGFLAKVLSPV